MTHEERIDREERAAIHEYEAGFTRETAEMLAGLRPNPTVITPEIADAARQPKRPPWSSRRKR